MSSCNDSCLHYVCYSDPKLYLNSISCMWQDIMNTNNTVFAIFQYLILYYHFQVVLLSLGEKISIDPFSVASFVDKMAPRVRWAVIVLHSVVLSVTLTLPCILVTFFVLILYASLMAWFTGWKWSLKSAHFDKSFMMYAVAIYPSLLLMTHCYSYYHQIWK